MENVDQLIVETLSEHGCPLKSNLRELSVEESYRTVTLVLSLINSTPVTTLSDPLEKRYQQCSQLANTIKSMGFRGDLGYETFLYGNHLHLRNVLLFLIQKIPRSTPSTSSPNTPKSRFLTQVSKVLQEQSHLSHLPWQLKQGSRSFSEVHPVSFVIDGLSEIKPIICTSRYQGSVCSLLTNVVYSRLTPWVESPTCEVKVDAQEEEATLARADLITEKIDISVQKVPEESETVEAEEENEEDYSQLEEIVVTRTKEVEDLSLAVELIKRTKHEVETELDEAVEEFSRLAETLDTIKNHGDVTREELNGLKETLGRRKARLQKMEEEWNVHKSMLVEECSQLEKKMREDSEALVRLKEEVDRFGKLRTEAHLQQQSMQTRIIFETTRHIYMEKIFTTQKYLNEERQEHSQLVASCREKEDHIFLVRSKLDRTLDELLNLLDEDPRRLNKIMPNAKSCILNIHGFWEKTRDMISQKSQVMDSTNSIDDKVSQLEMKNTAEKTAQIGKDFEVLKNQNKILMSSNST